MVLVTGASGYVGSHCIKQLLEAGEYRVRGTIRSLKNEAICQGLNSLVPDAKFPLQLVEADLLVEESWKNAVNGCTYVLHVASPFFVERPKNEDELMKPAVDGTLNVLKACQEVGGVKKVVLTSSLAAIYVGNTAKVLDEEMWSDPEKCSPYERSKLTAEKAAWEFVGNLPKENQFELVVINPGFITGPLLLEKTCTSYQLVRQLIERDTALVPDIKFLCVDVRDVAKAHIIAMTNANAVGKRHILSASEEAYSFVFLAQHLASEFNSKGFNVPTKTAPKALLWVISWFNKDVRNIYPMIGLNVKTDITRLREVLGMECIKIENSIIEMGHSLVKLGMVKTPEAKKAAQSKAKSKGKATKEEKREEKTEEATNAEGACAEAKQGSEAVEEKGDKEEKIQEEGKKEEEGKTEGEPEKESGVANGDEGTSTEKEEKQENA